MWVARLLPNGEFHAQFRSCVKGKASDQFQDGWWSMAGDIETIKVSAVNGQFFPRSDDYKILFQDGRTQRYRFLRTGFVYSSRKVDDKFQMPSCEAIS